MIWLIFERSSGLVVSHVESDDPPVVLSHHDVIESETLPDYGGVRIVDGALVEVEVDQAGVIADLWRRVRDKRNRLLSACDYLVQPDYPISESDRQAIYEYRQTLRDITEGDPHAIVWPMMPVRS